LAIQQGGVLRERRALLGVVGVLSDLFEAGLHSFDGNPLFVALAFDHLRKQPILTTLLLAFFFELLLDSC
jgi:hypothetical protein